jgi:hypothetical protein
MPPLPPKIILFGPPGSGKTGLVMTGGAKVQIAMTDIGGWKTAKKLEDSFKPERLKCDIIDCTETLGQAGSGFTKLKDHIYKTAEDIRQKRYPFTVFAVDSLTSVSSNALRYIQRNSGILDSQGRVMMQFKNGTPFTGTGLPHYGGAITEVLNIIQILQGFPIAVILVAHDVKPEADYEGEVTKKTINVIGQKLAPQIMNDFFEIWYADIEYLAGMQENRILRTKIQPTLMAKSRDSLPDKLKISEGLPVILKRIEYDI